jgi:archaellum component FlaC
VAKYTRQLTTEVNVQTLGIATATQRIGELVNMRDNHSASRGPEFIEQCNTEIARAERSIEGSKAILTDAQAGLQKLAAPHLDVVRSVSQMVSPAAAAPSAAAPQKATAEPVTIVHNGSPVTVDPANTGDVAKYTRQLTTEVNVQTLGIATATQRIGELVNMRDNHSASRGPEFIEQCNTEIARAERSIEGSKAIIEQAETSLQKLGSIPSELDVSSTLDDAAVLEAKPTIQPGLSTPEEDHGPEMD